MRDARAPHPDATLADLYNPLTMPPALAKAHAALDRTAPGPRRLDRLNRPTGHPFRDARRRFEHRFTLYESLTAPLTASKAEKAPKR